jgi:hypothetical protein
MDGTWREIMKKTMIAVFLALMLAVSAIPAFAHGGDISVNGTVRDDSIGIGVRASGRANASDDNPQSNNETRREGRDRAEDRQELMAELKAEHRGRIELLKQARNVSRAHIEAAIERIKEKKEHLKELQDEYKGKRDDVKKSRDEAQEACKTRRNATECKEARERFNENSKQFVGNAADQMLVIITTMKERVQTNPHIDNATATKITAQLDARASAIIAAQAKLNTSNDTQAAAQELRTTWQQARVTIRLSEGLLVHARFQEFIDKLTNMETKLSEASAELKANGTNTTQLDADIAAFGAKLDAGAQSYISARDAYIDAMATVNTEAEANTLVKTTQEQLRAAEKEVKDARTELRAVIKDLRALDASKLNVVAAEVSAHAKAKATVEDSEVDS